MCKGVGRGQVFREGVACRVAGCLLRSLECFPLILEQGEEIFSFQGLRLCALIFFEDSVSAENCSENFICHFGV